MIKGLNQLYVISVFKYFLQNLPVKFKVLENVYLPSYSTIVNVDPEAHVCHAAYYCGSGIKLVAFMLFR